MKVCSKEAYLIEECGVWLTNDKSRMTSAAMVRQVTAQMEVGIGGFEVRGLGICIERSFPILDFLYLLC